jgi:hypothetical protein
VRVTPTAGRLASIAIAQTSKAKATVRDGRLETNCDPARPDDQMLENGDKCMTYLNDTTKILDYYNTEAGQEKDFRS